MLKNAFEIFAVCDSNAEVEAFSVFEPLLLIHKIFYPFSEDSVSCNKMRAFHGNGVYGQCQEGIFGYQA